MKTPSSYLGFPGSSDAKEFTCSVGDPGWIPEMGSSPGDGNGNLRQYSCLENFMDREAWWSPRVPWGCKESDMTEQLRHIVDGSILYGKGK